MTLPPIFSWRGRSGTERDRRIAIGTLVLATLVSLASLGGLLLPATYARETANWSGQAIGQDWFDLVIAVPWLLACAIGALRAPGRWHLLLGGALLFTIYTFVIYTFSIHFNELFLLYCAILGLSVYLTMDVGRALLGVEMSVRARAPNRTAGGLLIAVGIVFGALWLGEIVPAILGGDLPQSVAEAGLFTNPVHVVDLSVVLPAHILVGVALLRRKRAGYLFAPVILAFGALMASSIAGMMLVMHLRGLTVAMPVAAAMTVLALATGAMLVRLLAAIEVEHMKR